MTAGHGPLRFGRIVAAQRGAVILVALIVVVLLLITGIAVMRTVDTTSIIAGNLAFQQAATNSADVGVETAMAWLQANNESGVLNTDDQDNGYSANGNDPSRSPATGQSWDDYWRQGLTSRVRTLAADGAGNTVSYVIDRLCRFAGAPGAGASCSNVPDSMAPSNNAEAAGRLQILSPSLVYYRITVRVEGPRNTLSYVQAVVAI